MRQIPLAAVPTQTLAVNVDGQAAQIELRQNGAKMYFSLQHDGVPVVTSRICRDVQMLLVDARYRGFRGDFMFMDMHGDTDPIYTGLGADLEARYVLVYLSEDELP